MKSSFPSPRTWSMFVASIALGATTMFVFDPDKGRRRRALLRDKTVRSVRTAAHLLQVSTRDLGHRTRGLSATARRWVDRNRATDDLVLIERVRAKMGRVVSHPHAVQIGARDGRVTLSGPILPAEAMPLLDAVRAVPGVTSIEDHLMVFDRPESIPSLQGGVRRSAQSARGEWRPAWRVLAVLGGGVLAACALQSRGIARIAFAVVGVGLAARGAADDALWRPVRLARRSELRNGDRRPERAEKEPGRTFDSAESGAESAALH